MEKITYRLNLFLVCVSLAFANEEYTLKSVSVAFRHGDRTPDVYPIESYPNDPYLKETFRPIGRAGLTNVGKRREYLLGRRLRKRYQDFLNDDYKSSEIYVISTPLERTEMSLQLVLAGVYPPLGKQVWNHALRWQPIPINVGESDIPNYSYPDICPTYVTELKRVKNTDEYKRDVSRFDELKNNLTTLTGQNMRDVHDIYKLYNTLMAEKSMNLTLPKWTKSYFPNGAILDAALFQYQTDSYTTTLQKLNGGLLVRKILNDNFYEKKNKATKLFLYSVHETNIASLQYTLNLWENIPPAYGSAIIFEFYESQLQYFIRILYYKSIPPELELQIIPGCEEFCPLEDFIDILSDVIPDDTVESCIGPPENSLFIPKNVNLNVWIYEKIKQWFNI